jgi:SAM-dependent methyltransferase
MNEQTHSDVKDYYGNILKTKNDLKTNACCCSEAPPTKIKNLLKNIHPTVLSKFYGCGSPLPVSVTGCTVLDLGCGTGRDVFLLSQLVGEQGSAIGVDMTESQLAVAKEFTDWHTNRFGYTKPNVSFTQGYRQQL